MKRAIFVALAALAALAFAGAARPAGPESLTLAVLPRTVTFGEQVHVSGVVSPTTDRVTVVGLPYDGGAYPFEATPDRAGRFQLLVQPLVTTQYRARAEAVDSAEAPVVRVRPRVHLVVISARRGVFHTRAKALLSYRGRRASLQRLGRSGWQNFERVRLGSRSAVRFRTALPRGLSRVRLVVEPSFGYARGVSRVATVRR